MIWKACRIISLVYLGILIQKIQMFDLEENFSRNIAKLQVQAWKFIPKYIFPGVGLRVGYSVGRGVHQNGSNLPYMECISRYKVKTGNGPNSQNFAHRKFCIYRLNLNYTYPWNTTSFVSSRYFNFTNFKRWTLTFWSEQSKAFLKSLFRTFTKSK